MTSAMNLTKNLKERHRLNQPIDINQKYTYEKVRKLKYSMETRIFDNDDYRSVYIPILEKVSEEPSLESVKNETIIKRSYKSRHSAVDSKISDQNEMNDISTINGHVSLPRGELKINKLPEVSNNDRLSLAIHAAGKRSRSRSETCRSRSERGNEIVEEVVCLDRREDDSVGLSKCCLKPQVKIIKTINDFELIDIWNMPMHDLVGLSGMFTLQVYLFYRGEEVVLTRTELVNNMLYTIQTGKKPEVFRFLEYPDNNTICEDSYILFHEYKHSRADVHKLLLRLTNDTFKFDLWSRDYLRDTWKSFRMPGDKWSKTKLVTYKEFAKAYLSRPVNVVINKASSRRYEISTNKIYWFARNCLLNSTGNTLYNRSYTIWNFYEKKEQDQIESRKQWKLKKSSHVRKI